MQTTSAERHESNDLEQRDARALTEYMTVLPLGGDVYSVTTQSGSEYRVDAREGRCTCPDHEYREVRCKHIRRIAFATGERPIPAWVDADEVDAQLGEHVEKTPKVAATDGGVTLEESATKDTDEDGCWCDDHDFPCFDCYKEGRRDLPGEGE
ncbi:SWIM zinc finger family protein [Haloarchaeobius sp. FL176]|uniref:SWIM zinc finger family protein n=1 Tax=Haloarchaeobius sp. FL176 TaxID=2967129 RepID=UPI002148893D|nr:SWIM zinc finger family protein [Haloarchaeobius sp. FL176]